MPSYNFEENIKITKASINYILNAERLYVTFFVQLLLLGSLNHTFIEFVFFLLTLILPDKFKVLYLHSHWIIYIIWLLLFLFVLL